MTRDIVLNKEVGYARHLIIWNKERNCNNRSFRTKK